MKAVRFINRHKVPTNSLVLGAVALIAILSVSISTSSANAAKSITPLSTPGITLMLEPSTSDGQMRLYQVANGMSYWTNDLPIYQGDKVKLDVFVATGADELQHLKVRVDNVPVADLATAPWSTTLSTNSLGAGWHMIEVWTQVSGIKQPQYMTKTQTFFVSPQTSAVPAAQPVTQVKGQEQILTGGKVVDVPLAPSTDVATPTTPNIPGVLTSQALDPKAAVNIQMSDSGTNSALDMSQPVHISSSVLATVVPAAGSTAQRFAYALVSDGQTIVAQDKLFPMDATRVRLQPRTASDPGLLPGTTYLWVWGVDSAGNYGQPVSAAVQIDAPTGS